ncbi:MAG: DUF5677 domain-containing protein [Lachnospiraceae bacterium]|jgi:hypothetical protein|nr:DUF5677 domain-containing protein [Lachnospiraceae bacterium]
MDIKFPSYRSLFEETKIQLNSLMEIALDDLEIEKDKNKFIFLLVGNINLKINTICFLLENNIVDSIIGLQRIIFELQIAFQSYCSSNNKENFLELYWKKRDFETTIKWDRVINGSHEAIGSLFSEEGRRIIDYLKHKSKKNVKDSTSSRITQVWYELASGKTTKDLSDEYFDEIVYFSNYDEPSNWIHPQRLEENMGIDFNSDINKNYLQLIVGNVRRELEWLANDVADIASYFNINKDSEISTQLYNYGEKLSEYDLKIRKAYLAI